MSGRATLSGLRIFEVEVELVCSFSFSYWADTVSLGAHLESTRYNRVVIRVSALFVFPLLFLFLFTFFVFVINQVEFVSRVSYLCFSFFFFSFFFDPPGDPGKNSLSSIHFRLCTSFRPSAERRLCFSVFIFCTFSRCLFFLFLLPRSAET